MDASSSSHQQCSYDVFLNFRGGDTRKSFTDHLYKALEQKGIHTFRDDGGIPRGTNIQQQLDKAIQESRVSVVVFSKDYASSRWCLDELVKINQRTKTDGSHIIIPVFYDVDPSDVRKQTGNFAQAFSKLKERFKEEMDMVEDWRRALRDVPDLAGMVLGDRYESEFIEDLVEEIGNKLDRKALYVASYGVGIDIRVREINTWLEIETDDVGIAMMYGMGGIGKTTIAKTAYNHNFGRFEGSSFLADVREISGQPKGLLDLQRQLLSDIQRSKAEDFFSVDEGIQKIRKAVYCKRVLIILDDVDCQDQLRAVLGERKWFHPGSKIIITTRNGHLLKAHYEVYKMFKVGGLDERKSLEVFSWHAFGQANPLEGFMELSTPLVQHCEGLPLALQVMGSSLSGQSVEIWQDALHNLDAITEGQIDKVLKISFDSLQVRDKSLFLHLACFFIRKEKDFIITVLDYCGFATRIELQNLVHRCLVSFEDNKLVMHELVRDMGMEIIREESSEDPGKRSRVLHKDAINILRKLTGTETIKGLMLNLPPVLMEDKIGFKTEAFTRMNNLEILVLGDVKFRGGYEHFPQNLIWLSWSGFPEKSIPENFSLAYVVALNLENSCLRHVWKKTMFLPRLKILNLSNSHGLITAPDFPLVPNLETLILEDCINLVEIGESIGVLEKLVLLNLKNCKNLIKLPRSISALQSLHTLVLSGCSKLVHYEHNVIAKNHQLHSTASNMKKISLIMTHFWQSMCLSQASSRRNVDITRFSLVNFPNCLSSLSLANCNLSEISSDVCLPSSLKRLDLSGNPVMSLPENMKNLIMLESLMVDNCTKLRTLPELPPSLKSLRALGCTSLKRITNLPNILTTLLLELLDCEEIDEVESLFMIKPLRSIVEKMNQLPPQYLGLFDFESQGSCSNELVEMLNMLTCTSRKLPPQALYECGIFSTFFRGSKMPELISYKSIGDFILSVTLPPNSHYDDLNCKIRGLNACVLYNHELRADLLAVAYLQPLLKVSNESKGLMWSYSPVTIGIPEENEDMLWVSHWLFGDEELDVGDTIRVSVHLDNPLSIKEFGIQIVEEEQDHEDIRIQLQPAEETIPTATNSVLASALYELEAGKYFLTNHWPCIEFLDFKRFLSLRPQSLNHYGKCNSSCCPQHLHYCPPLVLF